MVGMKSTAQKDWGSGSAWDKLKKEYEKDRTGYGQTQDHGIHRKKEEMCGKTEKSYKKPFLNENTAWYRFEFWVVSPLFLLLLFLLPLTAVVVKLRGEDVSCVFSPQGIFQKLSLLKLKWGNH